MDPLGRVWHEHEAAGWAATWTRQNSSNRFIGRWANPNGQHTEGVLTVIIQGTNVLVSREDAPGYTCNYQGTLDASGTTVTGTYGCDRPGYTGPYPWGATITH
jgi:hypothetical protein